MIDGKYRWVRLAGPIAVVLALALGTLVAHTVELTSPSDRDYLSPTSTADAGASRLAGRLAARGVRIERMTGTPDAIRAASGGDATVFVPAPGLVWPEYLSRLTGVPVVLVAPDPSALGSAFLNVRSGGPRWTAAVTAPDCQEPWATGDAAVLRRYYAADGPSFRCYGGGVMETGRVTLVGAADPFRNDRIGEHANEAVAVGLLSRTNRVIWLDLHRRELPPRRPRPTRTGPTQAPPEIEEPDEDEPEAAGPTVFDAFPPSLWASLVLLLVASAALAAAAGRRLGAPVAEPLPVRVRAGETVRGLGDLYRRARAEPASLAVIQAAARRRLSAQLGLPPDSSGADIAGRLPGFPPERVRTLLDEPGQDLATTAEAVQNLVRQVKGNQT